MLIFGLYIRKELISLLGIDWSCSKTDLFSLLVGEDILPSTHFEGKL